jgi:hypothetical protein
MKLPIKTPPILPIQSKNCLIDSKLLKNSKKKSQQKFEIFWLEYHNGSVNSTDSSNLDGIFPTMNYS